ncbi:MAG TPA: peptidylprolyl isomerase [Verrucomicrobiae bacterium]|nr:peptidylprolyl isomerase [Verrucomicrobiae bacterium]
MKIKILYLVASLACAWGLSGCFFGLFGDDKGAAQTQPDPVMMSAEQQNEQKGEKDHKKKRKHDEGQTEPSPVIASEAPPPMPLPSGNVDPETEVAVITTPLGKIVIALNDEQAPKHSENFRRNIRTGLYNGTTFHRIVPGFIVQGGDPNSKDEDRANDGLGGTGYTLPLEKKLRHDRGAVAAARKPDKVNPQRRSNGSQFYVCVSDAPFLDGKYSVFGRVVSGMDVVDRISKVQADAKGNPQDRIEIKAQLMKFKDVGGG